MTVNKRITVGLDGHAPEELEMIEKELGLNTTDAVRKSIGLLALMVRRQNDGCTPAIVRPDGSVQEIYFL